MDVNLGDGDRNQEVTVYLRPPYGEAIPFDVFSSLSGAITALYPDARMGPGEGGRGFALIITPEDRKRRRTGRLPKRKILAAHEPFDPDAPEGMGVFGWDGESLSTSTPEVISKQLAELAHALLDGLGAQNYVESLAFNPAGRQIEVTARWGHGQTPHQMRQKAERERDELRAAVLAIADEWEGMGVLRSMEGTTAAKYGKRLRELLGEES